jgi:predicted dinucleotide-binding enzyme
MVHCQELGSHDAFHTEAEVVLLAIRWVQQNSAERNWRGVIIVTGYNSHEEGADIHTILESG